MEFAQSSEERKVNEQGDEDHVTNIVVSINQPGKVDLLGVWWNR